MDNSRNFGQLEGGHEVGISQSVSSSVEVPVLGRARARQPRPASSALQVLVAGVDPQNADAEFDGVCHQIRLNLEAVSDGLEIIGCRQIRDHRKVSTASGPVH